MSRDYIDDKSLNIETRLMHLGSDPAKYYGMLNPPIFKGSTIVHDKVTDLLVGPQSIDTSPTYGRDGTQTGSELAQTIGKLENAKYTVLTGSGLSAIAISLLSFLKAGDHVLSVDSVYVCTKEFLQKECSKYSIETTFYKSDGDESFESLFQENTKVVYIESPSSGFFEIYDVPKMVKIAKEKGAIVLLDNSWATPLFFQPLDHGVDVSIQSCTKFLSGHSDTFLGAINTRNEEFYREISMTRLRFGLTPSPEDAYNIMRGLRTMPVRVQRHQESSIKVAKWLQQQDCVDRVLHPALPTHPQHDIWKRDFKGATGVFSFMVEDMTQRAVFEFVESLNLFHIGFSWEGLIVWQYRLQLN